MIATNLLALLRSQSEDPLESKVATYLCSGCGSTLAMTAQDQPATMTCANRGCRHRTSGTALTMRSVVAEVLFACRILLLHPAVLDDLAQVAGVDGPELRRWVTSCLTFDAGLQDEELLRRATPFLDTMIRYVFVGRVGVAIHFRRATWLPAGWRGVAHHHVQQGQRGVDTESLELFQTRIIRAATALGEKK